MQGSVPESMLEPSSSIGLNGASITWRLNYKSGDFQVIGECKDDKLGELAQLSHYGELLGCFEEKEKRRFVRYLHDVRSGRPRKPIRVIFSLDETDAFYCLFSAVKKSNTILFGRMLMLFRMPRRSQLSKLFVSIFDNRHHGMVLTDKNGNIVACNACYEKFTGYGMEELLGKNTRIFKSGKLDDDFYVNLWASLHYEGQWLGKILSKRKDGRIIPQELTVQTLDFSRHSTFYLGITRDLSDIPREISGEQYGGVELFTQLPNEKSFNRQLEQRLDSLPDQHRLFVIVLEPEISKEEAFQYKLEMATIFQQSQQDLLVGYCGNNRFLLSATCPNPAAGGRQSLPKAEFLHIINQVKQGLSDNFLRKLSQSNVGMSIFGEDARNSKELRYHAIAAMKEAHHIPGHKSLCVYSSEQHQEAKRRNRLKLLARKALKQKSVEVFFQPIIQTGEWKIAKFEALCRFRDNNGALLNTQEMVSIVESIGMVKELDLLVAEKAIWEREVLTSRFGTELGITINVSLSQSDGSEFALKKIHKLLLDYQEAAPFITVEITESAFFDSCDSNSPLLDQIKTLGTRVAIDDFGTGFSSFSYLKQALFDIIKIDREFVSGLREGTRNYHIVSTMVSLAKRLQVQTIAEGVETLQEALLLEKLGVDMLQGFYFSEPKPSTKITTLSTLLYKLKKQQSEQEDASFISQPLPLTPNTSLLEVMQVFESNDQEALPIINSKKCVGLVDKITYSLNLPPSLGGKSEKRSDLQALKKKVIQFMDTHFHQVNATISVSEVLDGIREGKPLPWVVVDEKQHYVGLIEHKHLLRYLAQQP